MAAVNSSDRDGGQLTVAAAAAAELKQMSTSQHPMYSRIAHFDIERKVSVSSETHLVVS